MSEAKPIEQTILDTIYDILDSPQHYQRALEGLERAMRECTNLLHRSTVDRTQLDKAIQELEYAKERELKWRKYNDILKRLQLLVEQKKK